VFPSHDRGGLDIRGQQEKLNQQKSDQINANKQADMQRKIDDSSQKFAAAQAELERKTKAGEDTIQAHKDLAAAVEERHKAEMTMKEHQFNIIKDQHQKTIDNLTEQLKQRGRSKTTTEINPNGTKRTTTTERGSAADTVQAIGKDGKTYNIPKDKLDDKDADGTPHWKQPEEQ